MNSATKKEGSFFYLFQLTNFWYFKIFYEIMLPMMLYFIILIIWGYNNNFDQLPQSLEFKFFEMPTWKSFVFFMVNTFLYSYVLLMVYKFYKGEKFSYSSVFGTIKKRFFPFMLYSLSMGFFLYVTQAYAMYVADYLKLSQELSQTVSPYMLTTILTGLFCITLPTIIFSIYFYFTGFYIMLDNVDFVSAYVKSYKLVSNHWCYFTTRIGTMFSFLFFMWFLSNSILIMISSNVPIYAFIDQKNQIRFFLMLQAAFLVFYATPTFLLFKINVFEFLKKSQ